MSGPCSAGAPLVIGSVTRAAEYSVQFEKDNSVEYCFIVYWEEDLLKKMYKDVQPLDQALPNAELILSHGCCSDWSLVDCPCQCVVQIRHSCGCWATSVLVRGVLLSTNVLQRRSSWSVFDVPSRCFWHGGGHDAG